MGVLTVDCPGCGARVVWTKANRWRPFCSERCKLIDLGDWAAGRYQIEGEQISSDADPATGQGESSGR